MALKRTAYLTQTAARRLRPRLRRVSALINGRRTRAYYAHEDEDGDVSLTADHVIDEPREPSLVPTGVLDARGQMLVRVTIPIKVPMGFHIPNPRPDGAGEVQTIVPEDMLRVSDIGEGLAHLTPEDLEGPDDEEDDDDGQG